MTRKNYIINSICVCCVCVFFPFCIQYKIHTQHSTQQCINKTCSASILFYCLPNNNNNNFELFQNFCISSMHTHTHTQTFGSLKFILESIIIIIMHPSVQQQLQNKIDFRIHSISFHFFSWFFFLHSLSF